MKIPALAAALFLFFWASPGRAGLPGQAADFRQLPKATALPTALDPAYQFRKTKLLSIGEVPGKTSAGLGASGPAKSIAIEAETAYRMFGAVTALDKRRRNGQYFDFFWRAKHAGPITVRLEYRQEQLRSLTQAREVNYAAGSGSHKTAFAIIGDDYFNDGRIVAWRCLLIAEGRIVAEDRSYLWR